MTPEYREVYRAYMAVNPETGNTFATPTQAHALANLVKRWTETHTPAFMDDAIEYCDWKGLPALAPLRRCLADAARQRRGNQLSKAMREGIKDEAFRVMANLIIRGSTFPEASGKAAKWINAQDSRYKVKASSLEKDYVKAYRRGAEAIEAAMREFNCENPDTGIDEAWRRIRDALPEPDDDERGERR